MHIKSPSNNRLSTNIPSGKKLTMLGQGKALAYRKQKMPLRPIAKKINRSETALGNFLRNPAKYNKKPNGGRPKETSIRERRLLIREAKRGDKTASILKKSLSILVSLLSVQRILTCEPHLSWRKVNEAPPLTFVHKLRRLKFPESMCNG